jgi:hypothetical protein
VKSRVPVHSLLSWYQLRITLVSCLNTGVLRTRFAPYMWSTRCWYYLSLNSTFIEHQLDRVSMRTSSDERLRIKLLVRNQAMWPRFVRIESSVDTVLLRYSINRLIFRTPDQHIIKARLQITLSFSNAVLWQITLLVAIIIQFYSRIRGYLYRSRGFLVLCVAAVSARCQLHPIFCHSI